jgi:hypothetical protein
MSKNRKSDIATSNENKYQEVKYKNVVYTVPAFISKNEALNIFKQYDYELTDKEEKKNNEKRLKEVMKVFTFVKSIMERHGLAVLPNNQSTSLYDLEINAIVSTKKVNLKKHKPTLTYLTYKYVKIQYSHGDSHDNEMCFIITIPFYHNQSLIKYVNIKTTPKSNEYNNKKFETILENAFAFANSYREREKMFKLGWEIFFS